MSVDGLTTMRSSHDPGETLARVEAEVTRRGMTVFARIDHAGAAAEAGLSLRPTAVVIFGAARGGTPLMQATQTIGIDLPLKILVWQDAEGATWVSYNEPTWLAARHGIGNELGATVTALATMLNAVATAATAT